MLHATLVHPLSPARPSIGGIDTTRVPAVEPHPEASDRPGGPGRRRLSGRLWYAAAPASIVFISVHLPLPVVSSLVTVTGLAVLAYADATQRHLPRPVVRSLAVAIAAVLAAQGLVNDRWEPLARAGIGGLMVFGIMGAVWWAAPWSVAFGDVRITAVAAAAAAAISWQAAAGESRSAAAAPQARRRSTSSHHG